MLGVVADPAGPVGAVVVLPLATVTVTLAEVAVLPEVSRATADSVWAPLAAVVVSQVTA